MHIGFKQRRSKERRPFLRKCFMGLALSLGLSAQTVFAVDNGPVFGGPEEMIYNIEITGVEISQGIQNLDNEMPLVAGRTTIVRVYARSTTGQSIPNIRARLFVSGSWDYPGNPLPGGGAEGGGGGFGITLESDLITVHPDGGSRLNLEDSFNFEVALEVPPSIVSPAQISIQAEVNWAFLGGELNNGDNLSPEIVRPLHVADALKFHFIPVHLHEPAPDADTEVDPNSPVYEHTFFSGPKDLPIAFSALRHLPASSDNSAFVLSWQAIPVQPLFHGFGAEWNLKRSADRTGVNERLKAVKLMSDDPNRIFYGMVDVDAATGGFSGWANNGVAWGVMSPSVSFSSPWRISGGMTLAHESGHRKGLAHMLCSGTEASGGGIDNNYPWPLTDLEPCSLAEISTEGYYGLDVYHNFLGQLDPIVISNDPTVAQLNRGFPLMGYKSPQWVSPYEFCKMMPNFNVPCDLQWPSENQGYGLKVLGESPEKPGFDLLSKADEYLVLSGLLNIEQGEVYLGPFYRLKTMPVAHIEASLAENRTTDRLESEWSLTLESLYGKELYRHVIPMTGALTNPREDQDLAHPIGRDSSVVLLNTVLPYPAGTRWIRVWREGKLIESREVSPASPTVSLLSQRGGEPLAPGDVIRWETKDDDDDMLLSTLRFSGDGGKTWQVVALDLQEQRLILTEDLLASLGRTDRGLFEVIVTDGVNTGSDRSPSTFKVANARPLVVLIEDAERTLAIGVAATFRAQALDPEDGHLKGRSLSWSSDQEGALGYGETLTTVLSAGRHLITVTAEDALGARAVATMKVTVEAQKR